jgi:8-oxo-dGTP pyrophosphatase MutT (NUDIX family)
MIRSRSAGGIVLGDHGTVALVRHRGSGEWLFPKGHLEAGEDDETAARREIEEETGLTDLELIDDLGEYERLRMLPDGTDSSEELKTMRMFLFAAPMHAEIRGAAEIEEAAWFPFRELNERIGNAKDRVWFASVAPRVRQAIQRD